MHKATSILILLSVLTLTIISTTQPINAQGLEKRSNQCGPVGMIFDYKGTSSVPSGWKLVNVKREVIGESNLVTKENFKGKEVIVYRVNIHSRNKLDGGKPLKFDMGVCFIGQNEKLTLFYRFRDHINDFDYNNPTLLYAGVAESATTRDNEGKVRAAAKLQRFINDEEDGKTVGVEVEETHLDSKGNALFKTISQYELSTGFKRFEKIKYGSKLNEYFSVWPTHN